MTEVILTRAVQTCRAYPSQWDAWDLDGNYWYLRYRHSQGTAERQPGPDFETWTDAEPAISFHTGRGPYDGTISLQEFCELAGLSIHPRAQVTP